MKEANDVFFNFLIFFFVFFFFFFKDEISSRLTLEDG